MYISKYIGRSRSRDGFHSSQVSHGLILELLKKAGSSFLKNRAAKAIAKKALVGAVKTGGKYLSKKIDNIGSAEKKEPPKTIKRKKSVNGLKNKRRPKKTKLRDIFSE